MVALSSKGIRGTVVVVSRPRKFVPKPKGRPRRVVLPLDLDKLPTSGDAWAVLDTHLSYGLNAVFGGEFQPYVQLTVRMVDAKMRATLYEQLFSYNFWGGAGVTVPLEGATQWDDLEAAKNDLPGVRAALATGIARVSELVAADLATR